MKFPISFFPDISFAHRFSASLGVSMSKNIIIISAFFPPARHIAVSRVEAYAKYLAVEHKVTVITLGKEQEKKEFIFENGASCTVYYLPNKGLLTYLIFYTGKETWLMHKFKTLLRVFYNKIDVSHFSAWAKLAKETLREQLKIHKVDVIISSYAPEDVLEVSYDCLIEADNSHTKWVLDMRDEYSDELGLTKKTQEKRQQNEVKYSQRADLVLSVSAPLVDLFRKRMPYSKEFMELRNGFDHDIQPKEYKSDGVLKIGYFGSLHGAAKPNVLFEAINQLGFNKKIKIYFAISNKTFDVPTYIEQSINYLEFMPYLHSIREMAKMDVNLLIIPSKTRVGVYSGKIFDYLSSNRPILALVNPNDVAAKLIQETNAGYIADFDILEEVKIAITQLYKDWESNKLKQPNIAVISQQHRKYQVQKLIEWID